MAYIDARVPHGRPAVRTGPWRRSEPLRRTLESHRNGGYLHVGEPVARAVELIAHHGAIPHDYRVIVFEKLDTLAVAGLTTQELPHGWPDGFARDRCSPIPSAVFPSEFNYILNPLHADFAVIRVEAPVAKYVDARLRR